MNVKTLYDIPSWQWPEGTGSMLLGILRDPQADDADRLMAAELAGDCVVVNDELATALLAIVGDSSQVEGLRAMAAIALGPALEHADVDEFDDPDDTLISEVMFRRIKDSLRSMYADSGVPKLVRRRILETSVRAMQEWHEAAIRSAYYSGDEEWKLTAVFGMQYVSGFDEQILEALDSDNPEIEYVAVVAAGSGEIKAALPPVKALLDSPDTGKPLLVAAIEAASYIAPEDTPMLLARLADSDDEDISDAAHEALALAETMLGIEEDDFGEWED